MATYYDSLAESATNDFGAGMPVSSSVAPTVDWSAASATSKPTALLNNEEFAVRWVGFVRPSRAQQYTFHMHMNEGNNTGHDERVKLWIDNSIIIQQWSSLASEEPSGTIAFGRANGYVTTLFGRKCHYPDIKASNPSIRAFNERAAINARLQGSAADIIRRAMVRMEDALAEKKLSAQMLLQVHDELIFEVPEDEVAATLPVVQHVMQDAPFPAVLLNVPLQVDARAADNWDEAH